MSAVRRRSSQPDLVFPPNRLEAYKSAESLEAMIEVAAEMLTPEEKDYLAVSVPAKMLELSVYRLFTPTLDDCRCVRKAWRRFAPTLTPGARKSIAKLCSVTAVRLLRQGHRREAAALVVPHFLASASLRLIYQLIFPDALRAIVRRRRAALAAA